MLSQLQNYLQPSASIDRANAQITAVSQTILRSLPPGSTPPLVITYNASTVPILQLALSGPGLSEQQLGDIGLNFLRTGLVTIPGVAVPYPYGGKQRQVQVDLDTAALQSKGLSPLDVVNAEAARQSGDWPFSLQMGDAQLEMAANKLKVAIDLRQNCMLRPPVLGVCSTIIR